MAKLWSGRVLWTLSVLFLLMDATIHLLKPEPVIIAFQQLGLPIGLSIGLGVLELACVILFVVPRTAVIGAVLLTGYLGGAVAINLRADQPIYFPFLIGAILWGALLLLDSRLSVIFEPRSTYNRP